MSKSKLLTTWPLRIATGAFILNSGWGKLSADEEAAAQTHGFAAAAYPFLKDVPPEQFNRGLAIAETAIGGALLTPGVPARVAGLGLTALGAGLLGLYLRAPGLREEGSLRPTAEGGSIAKDSWLLGAGLSLMAFDEYRRRHAKG